jgi:hypothetical protein
LGNFGQFWAKSWAIILSELPKKNPLNDTMEADFLSLGNLGKKKVNKSNQKWF